nr:hypothetical protein [Janthinobacterium sp. FT68W]
MPPQFFYDGEEYLPAGIRKDILHQFRIDDVVQDVPVGRIGRHRGDAALLQRVVIKATRHRPLEASKPTLGTSDCRTRFAVSSTPLFFCVAPQFPGKKNA